MSPQSRFGGGGAGGGAKNVFYCYALSSGVPFTTLYIGCMSHPKGGGWLICSCRILASSYYDI